jgi:hypothetical protein
VQDSERAAPRARIPCAALRVPRTAWFRAAQGSTGQLPGSTGNARAGAARPGATRAARRAHGAALFRECALGTAPRREGARRLVKKKLWGGGRQEENGNRSQDQGRTDAASLSQAQR